MKVDNTFYAFFMRYMGEDNIFYKSYWTTSTNMYDVWFLRINVSDGIDYALANLFYTRIISSEASYRIFLYMRMLFLKRL